MLILDNSLADNSTFMSDCKTLLGRMFDTVASNVTLSGEVTLLPAKVTAAQLTFENNKFVFKSSFRVGVSVKRKKPLMLT
jgi:hypothetical protein